MNVVNQQFVIVFFAIIIQACTRPEVKHEYYESGTLKSQCELKQDGVTKQCKMFYEDGSLSAELLYKNEKKDGVCKYFSTTGNLSQIVTYQKGLKHGPYTMFHRNGRIAERGNYYFNRRRGRVTQYYDDNKNNLHYQYLFFSYDSDLDSSEFMSEFIEYDSVGRVIKTRRNTMLEYLESGHLKIKFKSSYDSGSLVIGDFDSLFTPVGKVDTLYFGRNETPMYDVKSFKGNTLRGVWTIYETTSDKDSSYYDVTKGLIEELRVQNDIGPSH